MEKEISEKFKILEEGQIEIKKLLLCQKVVLNFNELVEYTGLSRGFLYKLSCEGKIPGASKPTGKHLFFDRKSIDTWLRSNGK